MLDTKAIVSALAPIVKSHVAEATAPLLARIAELEKRQPERGEPGERGRDGADGADGKDAEPISDEQIAAAVERFLTANPPLAGKDGRDGVDGKDGAPGLDADMDVLKSHCENLIAALPKPENGKDGRDGTNGKDGAPGERGADGRDGKDGADGVGLAGAMIDRDGELNITLTNGEVRKLGPVVGRDGKNGERGDAGFSLTDFDTDWRPDEKILVLSWVSGDTRYSHELFIPYLRDAGVWSEGVTYLKGDGVTWGGSLWIAQDDTADRPEAGKSWRLAVKRGRDGKDFAGPQPSTSTKVKVS